MYQKFNKRYVSAFIFLGCLLAAGGVKAQVTGTKFYLNYNSASCVFEAHMVVATGTATAGTNQVNAGAVQYTIVIPAGSTVSKVANNEPKQRAAPAVSANWSFPQVTVNAPAVTPGNSYNSATLNLSPAPRYDVTLSPGTDLVLFTFTVSPNNCGAGVRMWDNTTDPDPSGAGMGGAQFDNSFTVGSPAETYVSNAASGNTIPPSPTISSVGFTCSSNSVTLNTMAAAGSACAAPLTYAYTAPATATPITSTLNPATFTAGSQAALSGTYSVIVKDANGCAVNYSRAYNAVVCAPLSVTLDKFSATDEHCTTRISWTSASERGASNYAIQRSKAGGSGSWETIGHLQAQYPNGGSYSFTDEYPANGKNLYRLQISALNGNNSYSSIESVTNDCGSLNSGVISIYPNPASALATLTGLESGMLLQVSTASGAVVSTGKTNSSTYKLSISHLAAGMYYVQVRSADGAVISTLKLVKE